MPKHLIATDGLLKGLILNLEEKDKYTIGRDPEKVDLVLEDGMVSRKHALLTKKEDGIYIKDFSKTNPILVNDKNISKKPHLLKENDSLKIGQTTFVYSEKKFPKEYKEPLKKEKTKKSEFETIFEESKEELEPLFEETPKEEIIEETSKEEKRSEKTIYDTIFEEEEQEELPFNLISEYEIILKVISGPNSGAEFGMEKGHSYTIGKDPNICDIAFNDLSVSKKHSKISIDSDGNVYIEDLGSRNGTIVNYKKIEEPTKISSQDLVTLGTTTFLILDQKEAVETIYSELPKKVFEKEEKEKIPWKQQILKIKHLAIAGSFLIIMFIMFLSFFSLFKSEKIEIIEKDPKEHIQEALKKFKGVEFSYNPTGQKLFLTGHILTQIDEKELLYNMDNLNFIENIENNVIIDELVWKNINDILSDNTNWRGVYIHSPKAGKFVIAGYIQTPQEKEALFDYLNTNFPYTDKLINNVVVEDILKLEITSLLISKGLSSISFELINGELVIAGRYSMKETHTFEKTLDELKKTKGIREIKNLAIKTTPDIARIDLSKNYLISGFASSNKKDISIIVNNKIINIGDSLDGMKVTDIKTNRIYLEKDGFKYKIDYNSK